jgi:hypothetical protein
VEWGTHPWLHVSQLKDEFSEVVLFNSTLTRLDENFDFNGIINKKVLSIKKHIINYIKI